MIHTLTFNPGIDLSLELEEFEVGAVQRPSRVSEHPGGKGMNVARALANLEVATKAWVFLGGPRGEKWRSLAVEAGVDFEAIDLSGETRLNIKIFETRRGRQTDLNLSGPDFDPIAFDLLLSGLTREIGEGDFVVAAGSPLPKTPLEAWVRLGKIVRANRGRLVVDTTGEILDAIAPIHPWMIRLNLDEFNAHQKTSFGDLAEMATEFEIPGEGPHWAITHGPKGAVGLSTDGTVESVKAPVVEVRGTVGAGDAFTAGFLAAWLEKEGGWRNALAWGAATAAGAVELSGSEFPKRARVLEILTTASSTEAD